MNVIMVTGRRPKYMDDAYDLMHPLNIKMGRVMRQFILEQGGYMKETNSFSREEPIRLVTGMALGADTVWAMVALKLKRDFPGVFELECAIPCKDHSKRMSAEDRKRYDHIIQQADLVTHVSKQPYKGWLMQKRNEYMVDISNTIFAVWEGKEEGGTYNCIRYAEKKGREIYRYFPTKDETWLVHHEGNATG